MADAMTEINDAWNQFNELLDSGTQMSILTKIILSTIGIAIMILVEKNYILRRWEGIVAAHNGSEVAGVDPGSRYVGRAAGDSEA